MGATPTLIAISPPALTDEDTLAALRFLLKLAEAGEIQGLVYVAMHKGDAYSGDVTGAAKERPIYALGLAQILEEQITQLIP